MDNIDVSPQFKSTCLSVPSPTASHIACLSGAQLLIRCLTTFEITRTVALPAGHDLKKSSITWSPPKSLPTSKSSSASTPPRRSSHLSRAHSNRFAIFDDDTTRVYDLRDEKWSAMISNGSGGLGKNVHVEFGANEDEVLVWSDFSASVKLWCLKTGRAVEIRDPKFTGRDNKGWGYRPRIETKGEQAASFLALLCRSSGTDILLLLAPQTYNIVSRIDLPTTDAAGLKWSRDGRWLAVWDAASAGYKLCIYTADGHLYRTVTREQPEEADEWSVEGLGIKSVEWVPGNEWLSVGGWDKRVRMLSTRTFSPVVFLDHTAVVDSPSTPVYTELVDGQGCRSYALTPQPVIPPKAPVEKNETGLMKQGISILAYNANGTLCATRDDSTPSTVWIWDLRSLSPRTVLVQYAPVRSLHWHPHDSTQLLIQTSQDSSTTYLYTAHGLSGSSSSSEATRSPEILTLDMHISKPAGLVSTKWIATWLATAPDKKPLFSFGHQQSYILVWPDGKDQILRFEKEDEEEHSDDSLYDILTGRTPVPRFHDGDAGDGEEGNDMDIADGQEPSTASLGAGLDDTFREKRTKANPPTTGQSVFDESGLDEMF